jgi:AraC-like DNA-binding protein
MHRLVLHERFTLRVGFSLFDIVFRRSIPRKTILPQAEAKSSIQVIERMMTLLEVLAHHHDAVSLKLLSKETGLHPSTAHRILAAMTLSGFVERAEPGAYRLGIRLLELGNIVKSRINIRQIALPCMQALHGQIGESVNLGIRHDDEIIYVERTSSGRSSVRVVHLVGARAPLHATAVASCSWSRTACRSCASTPSAPACPASRPPR